MKKEIIVVAVGTFDILHLGHIDYLKQAKSYGDKLIVIVSSCSQVEKRGKKPYFTDLERTELLKELKVVDEVYLGDKTDIFKLIHNIKPDVICLGYDNKIDIGFIKKNIPKNIKIVSAKAFNIKKYASSKIKK